MCVMEIKSINSTINGLQIEEEGKSNDECSTIELAETPTTLK